jgi:hypothetical protein
VFHGEEELVCFSYEVGIAVSEGVEVSGASEGLTELCAVLFAHVVDEDDGHLESALQFTQEAEQCGDVGAGVLIGAVQSDQRVQKKKSRCQMFDGIDELGSIGVEVESQGGGVDDVEVEALDIEIPAVADSLDSLSDHGSGIFCEVDEGGAFSLYLEVSETRRAGGDAEGEVESEPGFAALWRAADDAHGLLSPQVFYEPSLREVFYRDVTDAPYG